MWPEGMHEIPIKIHIKSKGLAQPANRRVAKMEEEIIEYCGECGKKYQTTKTLFGLTSSKCFECKIICRIDAVLYHFGVDR